MKPKPRVGGIVRRAAWAGVLLILGAIATAGAPADDLKRYNDDLRLLSAKVAQYRHRLKASGDGAARLAALETELARLKAAVEEMTRLVSDLESKDSRLRYLKVMEVEPKGRELERVRQGQDQRYEQLAQQRAAVEREWAWWATQQHTFKTPEEEAGLAAAWTQYNRIKAMDDRYKADLARAEREMREEFDRALAVYTQAQRELSEAETSRERVARQLEQHTGQYGESRAPLVEQLVDLDNTPPPASVPLTPFSNGVLPSEAGLVPVVRPPVGPGANTRALDQLRVVTASSRGAAGRDAGDQDVTVPVNVTASTVGSYQFDTGGGLDPAALPEVDAPPAAAAVPLVVPSSPTVREDAPATVRNSPKLQELATRQADNVRKLDELYAARRTLVQQGAAASPAELTKMVQDISTTHAAIAMDVVTEKLAEGSKTIDLTIVPKTQRKRISDIVVPPPETNPPPPPPQ